jgi:hypothetical protein
MARYRHSARLRRMLELPMAAALRNLIPAIIMDKAQNISRLHVLPRSVYRTLQR